MARGAINGGKLDDKFIDFLDILDAEALDVVITLSDYKAMSAGERATWRAWKRARRQKRNQPPGQGAAEQQADPAARAAWMRARAAVN